MRAFVTGVVAVRSLSMPRGGSLVQTGADGRTHASHDILELLGASASSTCYVGGAQVGLSAATRLVF